MSRFLRSKRRRALLWYAAEGKCKICGEPLPENWHADHIEPWWKTHRTNVHEMQASCPYCNQKKGRRINMSMEFRSHQKELMRICESIIAGSNPESLLFDVCPGGGKSILPCILANRLLPHGKFEKLCWIVPGDALRKQGAQDFKELSRAVFNSNLELYEARNDYDPSRGSAGYVTTYASLKTDPDLHRREFERFRYAVIPDEFHHCAEGNEFYKAVKPLIERAAIRLFMSGTLERGDGKRIGFLDYDLQRNGEWKVNMDSSEDIEKVTYSISDALAEHAIIPLYFDCIDGQAKWLNEAGQEESAQSLETRESLFAALDTEYARQLLSKCVARWQEYRKSIERSSLLVVCAWQKQARSHAAWLQQQGLHAGVALSDINSEAIANIAAFKAGSLPILVTVGKAYEGLDVKHITHIACLTHIRSAPWILQMLARSWRFDQQSPLPWALQFATAFVPDDPYMRDLVKYIRGIMNRAYRKTEDDEQVCGNGGNGGSGVNWPPPSPPLPPRLIVPLSSATTTHRASDFEGLSLSAEDTAEAMAMQADEPLLRFLNPLQVHQLRQKFKSYETNPPPPPPGFSPMNEKGLTDRMKALRRRIEDQSLALDKYRGVPWGTTNTELVQRFKKNRDDMTEKDLLAVWTFLAKISPHEESL
jgi:superfamily II DNA or RNA helicase